MRLIFAFIFIIVSFSGFSQSISEIGIVELQQKLANKTNRIQVYNFWASWCGPCVKELPIFEELNSDENVDVTLVSVDFVEDIEKAKKALQKCDIRMETFLLNAKNYIEAVDKNWSGAIPATLIIEPSGRRFFYERALSAQELKELINNIL